VNRHLWSEKKRAYVDCIREDGKPSAVFSQQTQTAAYISGVASGKRAERCRQIVHKAPAGFVEAGSPFFMFFLLEALVREGRYDSLVETIRSYWGRQIEAGATTFWEMFHKDAPRLTRSHCHAWSAAPVVFLTQHVLGVRPGKAGYATTVVAPRPGNLAWAQGRVPTPRGVVQCTWKNEKDGFELEVIAPEGMPIEIDLPVKGRVVVETGRVKSARGALVGRGPVIKLKVVRPTKRKVRSAVSK
jgi:alpha-L-rhamnosidase